MLVTNGTRHAGAAYGFGAPLGAGGGRILSGPFRGQSVGNIKITILPALKGFDRSILEAQLRQKALELLLQRVGRNTTAYDVVGMINQHGAGKLPLVSSSFALFHELLLDLSHPKLLESLRLSVIRRSSLHELLCHLLTERHAGEG